MKKRLSVLFLVFLLFLTSLFACSNTTRDKRIVISLPMGEYISVWKALANDYMSIHKDVQVDVLDKNATEYQNWLINAFATGSEINGDIVTVNEFPAYINENKFLKLNNYLNKISPYISTETEKLRWKDGLEEEAYKSSLDNKFISTDTYCISLERVQVAFFYNKRIFEQCGITQTPRTWDELVNICEILSNNYIQIEDANGNLSNAPEKYQPIAIPGEGRALDYYFNWLTRVYSDQYFRDLEPNLLYEPNDYFYDEERDANFVFDINDLKNDMPQNMGINVIKFASEIYNDGIFGPNTAKYREMMENFAKIFPKYAIKDFFSATLGLEYYNFYNAISPIILDASWFLTDFDIKMSRKYQTGWKKFDYGIFYLPPMGMEVDSQGNLRKKADSVVGAEYTRSLGGAVGYLGALRKSKAQNDLNADFLMYYSSPRGQDVKYSAMKKKGLAPKGTILLKNYSLDADIQSKLDKLPYLGECDFNIATTFAYGFMGDEMSRRDVKGQIGSFLQKQINVNTMAETMQKDMKSAVERWIKANNFKSTCLQNPGANPYN